MRTGLKLTIAAALLTGAFAVTAVAQGFPPVKIVPMNANEASHHRLGDFTLTAIDGAPMPLAKYRGKVVLLVNTATQCGFKQQLAALQTVHADYQAKGFTVVAVPSGDFRDQELGTSKAIAEACSTLFGVRYPMAEKSHVIGESAIPLYKWAAQRLGVDQAPRWNFHKYLIGRDGRLIRAFGTRTEPTAPEVRTAIEQALKA